MTTNTPQLAKTRWALRTSAVLALVLGATVFSPITAQAAGSVRVSDDGVNYGSTYSGVLFDDIAVFVPGDTQTQVFHVRNDGPDPGFLRITLGSVAASDGDLASAISVSASVPAFPGEPVILSQAAPCWVLTEGRQLAAGQSITVTATLTVADLDALTAQGAHASFTIGVGLSDITPGTLPPTECRSESIDIPAIKPPAGKNPDGSLSYTGTELPVPLIAITGLALGTGIFLVAAARRRKTR